MSSSSSSSALELKHGIQLVRHSQTRYVVGGVDGFRFTVSVQNPLNMPLQIFRYLLLPIDPNTGTQAGYFDGVCSSADLADLPINAPLPNVNPAFFRLSTLDLVFRSQQEANLAWLTLKMDVDTLCRTLDLQDVLDNTEVYQSGTA